MDMFLDLNSLTEILLWKNRQFFSPNDRPNCFKTYILLNSVLHLKRPKDSQNGENVDKDGWGIAGSPPNSLHRFQNPGGYLSDSQ